MNKLLKLLKPVSKFVGKQHPMILIGMGVAGLLTTTILAVKATPKAMEKINEAKLDLELEDDESLPVVEVVKATWKCYLPCLILGLTSATCVIGASAIHMKRNAALAVAYAAAENSFKEYREATKDYVPPETLKKVKEKIAKSDSEKMTFKDKDIFYTTSGSDIVFYDSLSGRPFKSTRELVDAAVNRANKQMLNEDFISLNDFYYELGVDKTVSGEDIGWNINNNYIEISYSSQLVDGCRPCVVINYDNRPKPNYHRG